MPVTLYDFMVETFEESELLLLCDSDSFLQKAKVEFSDMMPRGEKVRRLINFCKRRGLSDVLWQKVKAERASEWVAYKMPDTDPNSPVKQVDRVQSMPQSPRLVDTTLSPTVASLEKPIRPLKIFLCHSSSDKAKVGQLYDFLYQAGLKPWLDSVDLIPGQQWQMEIPKAIQSSDVILVCLSKSSVSKEGYIQKEIKFALDKALEMPDGHIFLIPVRLEECDLPYSLQQYQWVDLFREGSDAKLLQGLELRSQQIKR